MAAAPRPVRRIFVANLVAQIGIVFTGALVRLTGSGLGCPSWPQCVPGHYTPIREQPQAWHKYVEFGNRALTGVLIALALAALAGGVWMWRTKTQPRSDRDRTLLALSAVPLLGTFAQVVAGGITVLTHLNPAAVAAHLLVSMAIIALNVLLVNRAAEEGPGVVLVPHLTRRLGQGLVPVAAVVICVGTVVTGSGPHAGDASAHRFHLDPRSLSWLHADLVLLLTGLSIGYAVLVRATSTDPRIRRVSLELLAMIGLQGAIGYTQYFTGLPELLVAFHVLGASLLWVAVLRVPLSQVGLVIDAPGRDAVLAGHRDR